MNIVNLRTFLAIVSTGNLARASAQMNVTQSTVTARLKALEDELGQTLINRRKSGATLTAAGMRLERYAETISDLWRQARQETSLPERIDAVCNVGCHPSLWERFGQTLLAQITEMQPNVALTIWRGDQLELNRWLTAGRTDISLSYSPNTEVGQTLFRVGSDTLALYGTEATRPHKFDPGYVFVEAGEEFGRDHATAYADAASARISFGDAALGLAYILEHGGSAYLPRRMARPYLQMGQLFSIDNAPTFQRERFVTTNSSALGHWPWFQDCLTALEAQDDQITSRCP